LHVGDRIEAAGVSGDVVDIGPMQIHLMEIGNWVNADQSTGRIVHIPNSVIFDGPVYNYTDVFNLIWNEIVVVVTHDSDWEAARTLLLEQAEPFYEEIEEYAFTTAEDIGRRYAYQRGITTPFVYVDLLRDGIRLTLRYLIPPRRRRGTSHDITTGFLRHVAAHPRIQLAPPAYRILHDHEPVGAFTPPAQGGEP
ncbi:MAG: mechanosensitive ion channel family protein, partial [Anaerolineales bacterium]|nr:mechanosensitive ion channel family protein [Anaerolineales bacterium]